MEDIGAQVKRPTLGSPIVKEWQLEMVRLLTQPDLPPDSWGSVRPLIAPHLPATVCKYRNVTDDSLYNLRTNTVWMASPQDLNDSFDTTLSIDYGRVFFTNFRNAPLESPLWVEIRELLGDELMTECLNSDNPFGALALHASRLGSESDIDPEAFATAFESLVDERFEQVEIRVNQVLRNSVKVCSFATSPLNNVMWSHYAGNHTGFCLEWDLCSLDDGEPLRNSHFPVIYSDSPLDVTSHYEAVERGSSANPGIGIAAALFKQAGWSYEEEWRLAFPVGPDAESWNYSMTRPVTVYLGADMTQKDEDLVRAAAKSIPAAIRRITRPRRGYRLDSVTAS